MTNELLNFLSDDSDLPFRKERVTNSRGTGRGAMIEDEYYVLENVSNPPDPFRYHDGRYTYTFSDIERNGSETIAWEVRVDSV